MEHFIRSAIFWKSNMAAGRHLGFTKMLIISTWLKLFGWNLNCIYLGITENEIFHQECEILKIQDGGQPPSWCTKMLITSAFIELLGWNLNCIYTGITEIGIFHQKCEILKTQDGGRPPSCIYQNVNNFCMGWAIMLQFELHIPRRDRNWKISSKMRNFENPSWLRPPSWIY